MPENKLQQRIELISILSKYRNVDSIDTEQLRQDMDNIVMFKDSALVCKTLFQEIRDVKSIYSNICAIIIMETIDDETLENEAFKVIKEKDVQNDKKFFIISLLKQRNIDIDLKSVGEYLSSSEELTKEGINDFLNNAIEDSETQIDLLDFYINLPNEEKFYFLENIYTDFEGDYLGNAFSILSQIETNPHEVQLLIEGLIKANSPFSIEGLEYILKNTPIETKTKSKIRRTLKKIINEHSNFINNETIKNSKVYNTYISFVDGNSDFTLVFSRITKENFIDLLLTTINTKKGIKSCMGFNEITQENFDSIIKRLFTDSAPININPIALKSLFEHYYTKTLKNNIEPPYELIVWKKIMNDIRTINFDISDFINSKLELIELNEEKVRKLCCATIMETWYYAQGQNQALDELIKEIEENHITDLDEINEKISKLIKENLLPNKEFISDLQSKLLLQSYVAYLANFKATSACTYSLCFNKKYLKTFIHSCLDKSIYYYLNNKLKELEEKDSVFQKNSKSNFTKDEIEILMSQLEEKWN